MKNLKLWIELILLAVGMGVLIWLTGGGGAGPDKGASATTASVAASGSDGRALAPSKPFVLKDSKGKDHALANYKGQVILLHFWATWCAPCVEEIPALMAFARKLEGKPFRLLLVGLDESWEQAWTVLPKQGLPSNVVSLIDPESKVPELYGSYQFPESYLIDGQQRITAKWVGMQKWDNPYFAEAVERLVEQ